MKIHFISIGGSIMHNLALELHAQGHQVTGSDDEIYEPALSRLTNAGILPESTGWNELNIDKSIDRIILGMHARIDNPELIKAQKLGLPIYSFPAYIYNASLEKKRIAICGSHGKTSTTSMVLHVLQKLKIDTDYLVGAQLEGFNRMVRLTDAPITVIEGDEYLSSALDRTPKMLHYHPQITVLTGIAWDHINVFKTFEIYVDQFRQLIQNLEKGTTLIYYKNDKHICQILEELKPDINLIPYLGFNANKNIVQLNDTQYQTNIFGDHNFQNLEAAYNVCKKLGITEDDFFNSIADFKGASKRLERIENNKNIIAYLDFAHAPSKLEATVNAIRSMYPTKTVIAFYELHTYSSFNETFMPHYIHTMNQADKAYIFIHKHSLSIKKMPMPHHDTVAKCFEHPNLEIITEEQQLAKQIKLIDKQDIVMLFMSSGNFGGLDLKTLLEF